MLRAGVLTAPISSTSGRATNRERKDIMEAFAFIVKGNTLKKGVQILWYP